MYADTEIAAIAGRGAADRWENGGKCRFGTAAWSALL